MSNELAVRQDGGELTQQDVETIKATLAKGTTDSELKLFLAMARELGLNPFGNHLYAIKFWDSEAKRYAMAPMVSTDGLLSIAERSGEYKGMLGPLYTADGKEWTDTWLEDKAPAAAKVGVLRTGFAEPLWGVATWKSYCQKLKDGSPRALWKTMPDFMLGKAAIRLAIKRAFPIQTGTDYPEPEAGQVVIDEAITPAQLKALHTLAGLLGWDADRRHKEAGAESFKDLTKGEASVLADLWAAKIDAPQLEAAPEMAEEDEEVVDLWEGELTESPPAAEPAKDGAISLEKLQELIKDMGWTTAKTMARTFKLAGDAEIGNLDDGQRAKAYALWMADDGPCWVGDNDGQQCTLRGTHEEHNFGGKKPE